MPFLPRPQKLKGMVGDKGFDPLGLSDWVPVEWLRESELKHGRVCMLAVVGFVATDLGFRLPGEMHQVATKLGTAVEHGGVQCDTFQQGSRSTSLQRRWCCAYNVPANNGSRRATRRAEVTGSGGTTSGQWQRDNRAALRWTCDRRKRVHRSQECGHHR